MSFMFTIMVYCNPYNNILNDEHYERKIHEGRITNMYAYLWYEAALIISKVLCK